MRYNMKLILNIIAIILIVIVAVFIWYILSKVYDNVKDENDKEV